ncbi:hypothetical protein DSCO28_00740 [Desulfosarcina ovata subsp. sediminis]|uniref:Methyltransferase type 11 n=1 Tax=Desulfosarcina ovata subsp. sediminis TaxID=885957 RepID=A0A5K7ZBG1_9BACT|nr:class I SAM-dependent methyltransferase [Desulfosarcina ovata]BBO79508.1 hypothetical protein DSCO28_00740 [Desulfosarcina ovata subsp. sediminis]
MTVCRCCSGSDLKLAFRSKVLDKYAVDYVVCRQCCLLQAVNPHWLVEAYDESINVSDTGIMSRNLGFRDFTALTLWGMQGLNRMKSSRYMDFGGGYGIFVRLMRDVGLDFYWSDEYSRNLLARGFEANHEHYDAVVAFEVFEHLVHPLESFEEIFSLSPTLIFSTELYPTQPPDPKQWWYYGFSHGQHITFFNRRTLDYVAYVLGLNLLTDGHGLHVLSRDTVSGKILFKAKFLRRFGAQKLLYKALVSKTMSDNRLLLNRKKF